MLITIVSQDKLTLAMFVDYYKSLYDSSVIVVDLNSIMSSDILNTVVKELIVKNPDRVSAKQAAVIVKLKTKNSLSLGSLPTEIQENSTVIIKFDIFSLKPEFLKDSTDYFTEVTERWERNIERKNKN